MRSPFPPSGLNPLLGIPNHSNFLQRRTRVRHAILSAFPFFPIEQWITISLNIRCFRSPPTCGPYLRAVWKGSWRGDIYLGFDLWDQLGDHGSVNVDLVKRPWASTNKGPGRWGRDVLRGLETPWVGPKRPESSLVLGQEVRTTSSVARNQTSAHIANLNPPNPSWFMFPH